MQMRKVMLVALVCAMAGCSSDQHQSLVEAPSIKSQTSDWREQYAHTLGVQAYVFGFPYVYLPSLRWAWVVVPKPAGSVTPYAALNHFHHVRKLADADYRDGGSPNNDTMYSIAWVDVSKEPVILSHPDMGDRYFTFELASLDSDNFDYVGTRTTGSKAGSYALVGPDWHGTLPAGVKSLARSRTNAILVLGRTLVDGPEDVAAVNSLQDQYELTPLSLYGKPGAKAPESREVWMPFDAKSDPLGEWRTMNKAMTENPPEARLAELMKLFQKIGIGPGQDIDKLDEATKRGLTRAAVDGRKLLNDVIKSGMLGKRVNHWNIPPRDFGRAGLSDDFLLRGSLQCLGGIVANDPEEAVYYNTTTDADGNTFNASRKYVMHFAPGQLPKVDAFWSITMYDPTYNLTPNLIHRYSIGNRTRGLKLDADGGLTIRIQATSPGAGLESNWLPCPASGEFLMIMRTYMPGIEIREQKWAPPAVKTTG
jgi:hypothetical protein